MVEFGTDGDTPEMSIAVVMLGPGAVGRSRAPRYGAAPCPCGARRGPGATSPRRNRYVWQGQCGANDSAGPD